MKSLCWIRRDLRLHDHAALAKATTDGEATLVFVFDTNILDKLQDKKDQRISFIYKSLQEMEKEVQKKGSSIIIRYGDPKIIIPELAKELKVQHVYCNRDYEPYAKERDIAVGKKLVETGIGFDQFKDAVIFEKHEIKTNQDSIYKVYTPYKNKWLEHFEDSGKSISDFEPNLKNLRQFKNDKNILAFDWYKKIAFEETEPFQEPGTKAALKQLESFDARINDYKKNRDFPAIDGTSLLSAYIRHGNISIRDMLRLGTSHRSEGAKTWVSELIWRDFYQMILDAFPQVEKHPYKEQYQKIDWEGKSSDFKAWCKGETGFPIIDAAMRCLNSTGRMHNRLRMIVASFLCKTLLVNWQKGEMYFAEKLLDYDLAANNGGWQWSASTGTDAQPYFRIFNPYSQSEKFDPKGEFIREWIPELAHLSAKDIHHPNPDKAPEYVRPIVDYSENRKKALDMYSVVRE